MRAMLDAQIALAGAVSGLAESDDLRAQAALQLEQLTNLRTSSPIIDVDCTAIPKEE